MDRDHRPPKRKRPALLSQERNLPGLGHQSLNIASTSSGISSSSQSLFAQPERVDRPALQPRHSLCRIPTTPSALPHPGPPNHQSTSLPSPISPAAAGVGAEDHVLFLDDEAPHAPFSAARSFPDQILTTSLPPAPYSVPRNSGPAPFPPFPLPPAARLTASSTTPSRPTLGWGFQANQRCHLSSATQADTHSSLYQTPVPTAVPQSLPQGLYPPLVPNDILPLGSYFAEGDPLAGFPQRPTYLTSHPRLPFTGVPLHPPTNLYLPAGQNFTSVSYQNTVHLTAPAPPPAMPYNTAAIPPRKEPTGTTQLPLSRVKKIIATDTDINQCSNNAAFAMTIATEMFIQHLAERAHNVVKTEQKPRRNIQYKDVSSSVARNDNLEFLVDIVPKTVPYKEVKEKKAPSGPAKATNGESSIEEGQSTLDGSSRTSLNGMNGAGHEGANDDGDDSTIADPNQQLEMEIRGITSTGSIGEVMNGQDKEPRDVEMGQ